LRRDLMRPILRGRITKVDFARYKSDFDALLERVDPAEIEALVDAIADAYRNDRFIFIIGNGGSGANASHLCEDLGKGTLTDFESQRRMKVMSLTDNTPYILALANDIGYEAIFVEQLRCYASAGDLLVAISGSGNSPNVVRAVEWAEANGLATFGVTGYDGGRLRQVARAGLHVPCDNMGTVEAVHSVVFHYLVDVLRDRLQP
jgi:D-sedoheptulose 7-phosphate isomerase